MALGGDLDNPSVSSGGSGAPTDATYITQTANGSLSAEQALGALATGILKNTTTTGVLSIAVADTDYQSVPSEGAFVDGDKTKLDGIESGATADQSDAEIETAINNQLTGTVVGTTDTQTLTNKSIDLFANTLSGTFSLFNAAVTDATLVSTTGSETLTNKTLTSPVINTGVSGTAIKDEDDMTSNSATALATQQSIKAYVDSEITSAKSALMPVGFIFISGVSTNPNTLLGFGTWTRIEGKFIVGVSDSDTDFDLDDTGGAKTATLTTTELPAHTHGVGTLATASNGDHSHGIGSAGSPAASGSARKVPSTDSGATSTTDGAHTHTITGSTASSGSGSAFSILNPFIAKYVWQRTA